MESKSQPPELYAFSEIALSFIETKFIRCYLVQNNAAVYAIDWQLIDN